MDEEGESPPFWFTSASDRVQTSSKSSSSSFYHSTLFMLIVGIVALLLLFLVSWGSFPISSSSKILNTNSVKTTWDSLNVLLVLLAIACGVFARRKEDVAHSTDEDLDVSSGEVPNDHHQHQPPLPSSSYEMLWYDLPHDLQLSAGASRNEGLRRNSNSYPNLRQHQSDWESPGGHCGFKYYDDFEICRSYHQPSESKSTNKPRQGQRGRHGYLNEKVSPPVGSYSYVAAKSPSMPTTNTPYQAPPPAAEQNQTKVHRSIPKRERSRRENATHHHQAPDEEGMEKSEGTRRRAEISSLSHPKPRRRKRVLQQQPVPLKQDNNSKSSPAAFETSTVSIPPQGAHATVPLKEEDMIRRPTEETSHRSSYSPSPKPTPIVTEERKDEMKILSKPETAADPPPPPPPPPPPQHQKSTPKHNHNHKKERKKNSAKREIAMVWALIYKTKHKKRHQHEPQQQSPLGRADSGNYNGISKLFSEPDFQQVSTSQLYPPPPPPPPPPHSVFHTLFRKATNKSKKIHSVSAPPPPPPEEVIQRPLRSTIASGKPPLPKRPSNWSRDRYEFAINSRPQSPVVNIPRPPPLPPFSIPKTKFVVRGDLARIQSNKSSQSGLPESFDIDESLISESPASVREAGYEARPQEAAPAAFCASPDVNAKADTFIARLRGEWRLEKINSVNQRTDFGFGPEI